MSSSSVGEITWCSLWRNLLPLKLPLWWERISFHLLFYSAYRITAVCIAQTSRRKLFLDWLILLKVLLWEEWTIPLLHWGSCVPLTDFVVCPLSFKSQRVRLDEQIHTDGQTSLSPSLPEHSHPHSLGTLAKKVKQWTVTVVTSSIEAEAYHGDHTVDC